MTSDALFSSSLHYNQIQKGYPHHLKDYGATDQQQQEFDAGSKLQDTNWFHRQPPHSQHNAHGFNYEHHQRNPEEDQVDHDFLSPSQQGTTTSTLPLQSNWVQNDHFPHKNPPAALHSTLLQPMYDQTVQPQQQQLIPAAETSEKPPLPLAQEKPQTFSLASLELLNNYGKGFKNIARREENFMNINNISSTAATTNESSSSTGTVNGTHKLALGEIMKAAGERYIQFSTQKVDGFSTFIHPYGSSAIMSDLSVAETADVELVQHLLIAAECVGHRQFELANALIARCLWVATDSGNAAQRIVFYFAEALQRRLEIETGRTTIERLNQQSSYAKGLELDFNPSFMACHLALPLFQVGQFAAMQTIIDNLKTATKIHLVDLHIRSGVQWTVLMQALAEQDEPPAIRITALGINNKPHIEETGKRLMSFAQSLNLTFSFNAIVVSDMKEVKEVMFRKEPDEAVAVYAALILRTMLSKADSLANVMKVIRRLRPSVVVVTEVEANHNSPSFITRFTESLFFYSAFFDCLEDCMERNNEHRKTMEGIYLGEGIRNMVGTEGDKRCTRNVKMDVWREYFARFGMAEVELGNASVRQANLILNKFHKPDSCNLTNNGKGLVIGWKGTPIHSLTTWKFV